MSTERLRSGPAERFWLTIGQDVQKARPGAAPIELQLSGVSNANINDDELVLLVVSRNKAFARRQRIGAAQMRASGKMVREILLQVAALQATVEQIAETPPRQVPQLSQTEASLLDEGGLPDEDSNEPTALERAAIELEAMRENSFTLEEAARALGVTPARLRQRLAPGTRTLVGLKDGRKWRIPQFQFTKGKRLVPGIDKVLPRVRPDAHALAIARWFTTPHQDLVVGKDEQPVTPLKWLSAGNDPSVVADLADEI